MRAHALDPSLRWRGVAEMGTAADGEAEFWRLPRASAESIGRDAVLSRARVAAGVSLAVRTDATALALTVTSHEEVRAPLDVVVDGEHRARLCLAPGRQRLRADLGGERVELHLPQRGRTTVGELEFVDASVVEAIDESGPRWIAHGSSITQGAFADGPLDRWVKRVAGSTGFRPHNLGLGGECHLDYPVAAYIRDAPADLISLCFGINVQMRGSFSGNSLGAAIEKFVTTVRDGHPQTPLVLVSPICSPEREAVPNTVGLTLADVRAIVADAAGRLGVHYVDGLDLLGPGEAHLLVDGLHPSSAGHALMAERLAPILGATP